MTNSTAPQLHVTAVVECPWCDGWTEVAEDATTVRCERCGVEADVVDSRPLPRARAA
jgi:hypothetical protein